MNLVRLNTMGRSTTGFVCGLFAAIFWLFPFRSGEAIEPGGSSARVQLPRAVDRVPEAVAAGAPFDVAKFFTPPPPDENAEALYLDAFFEFDPILVGCFPRGAETTRREGNAKRNLESINGLSIELSKNPAAVSMESVRRLIERNESGLKKIYEAQRRTQCMFRTGLDIDSPLPHAQGVRAVAKFLVLHAHESIERGKIGNAINDVATTLRAARDLRPRGPLISQVVAVAIVRLCMVSIVAPILASPALTEGDARNLLALLVEHERITLDGFEEGTKCEYLLLRNVLDQVTKDPRGVILRLRLLQGTDKKPLPKKEREFAELVASEMSQKNSAQIKRVNLQLSDYFRGALANRDIPYPQWDPATLHPSRIPNHSAYAAVALMLMPALEAGGETEQRARAYVRGYQCLVSLRLFTLRSGQAPKDLEVAVKAAGLSAVPIDPYSGRALQIATLNGETVVYSIGRDGRDEGGRIDAKADRDRGDLIFPLPR